MFLIEKISRVVRRGERLQVRGFKYSDDMHKFLGTGDNAIFWRECKREGITKAGTYAFAGGKWHNVKTLDACILAHI